MDDRRICVGWPEADSSPPQRTQNDTVSYMENQNENQSYLIKLKLLYSGVN
jgi:hypothetical protein